MFYALSLYIEQDCPEHSKRRGRAYYASLRHLSVAPLILKATLSSLVHCAGQQHPSWVLLPAVVVHHLHFDSNVHARAMG